MTHCKYFILLEFDNWQTTVFRQAFLVLTVRFIFFSVVEVVNERIRTKRSQDHKYSFLVSKTLDDTLKPSSLRLNLQRTLSC